MVIVELVQETTQRWKTADSLSARLRRASWRPPLLVAQLAQVTLRWVPLPQALLALAE